MACSLTSARGLACKDTIGGVKAVYLADFDPLVYQQLTIAGGEITGHGATGWTAYRYDVRPTSSGLVTEMTNEVAGSAAYNAKLSLVLHKATATDNAELEKLIQGRVFAWVLDANDILWSLGAQNGCTVASGTMSVGTARTDLHGYTLEIEAHEGAFPLKVIDSADPAAATYPFDGLAGTGTITVTNPA